MEYGDQHSTRMSQMHSQNNLVSILSKLDRHKKSQSNHYENKGSSFKEIIKNELIPGK